MTKKYILKKMRQSNAYVLMRMDDSATINLSPKLGRRLEHLSDEIATYRHEYNHPDNVFAARVIAETLADLTDNFNLIGDVIFEQNDTTP